MNAAVFKRIAALMLALVGFAADIAATPFEPDTLSAYELRMRRRNAMWNRLIPDYAKIQTTGGMGLISVGPGWSYGRNRQWETDLLLGIIPRHSSKSAKMTLTLKEGFNPWRIGSSGGRLSFEPLSTGLYINMVMGSDFWMSDPDKYPQGYYWFSTRMRFHIFLGQRLTYNIPHHKRVFCSSVTAFYELSTCDLYVIQAVKNSYLGPRDWMRLSFGLKFCFD